MIATATHKSGSSGSCLGYMLGDMLEKDQQIRIVSYNGFALSRLKIAELERIPTSEEAKITHKKNVWKIANDLSKIFDARAALADYRVNDPFEDYVVSCTDGERNRLRNIPTAEERENYGLPILREGEKDNRPLERIILDEFLEQIGVHGEIDKKLRRKNKGNGKQYMVTKTVHREAMFLIAAHDGTAHPHWHVLTARPDEFGLVNDTRNERYRILAVVRKLSKRFNLSLKLENYKVNLDKTNEGYATLISMRDTAKAARDTSADREELIHKLAEKGVVPNWLRHKDTGEEYGVTFTMKDKNGKEHTWSGSQLDRSLTMQKIDAVLALNSAARQIREAAAPATAVSEVKAETNQQKLPAKKKSKRKRQEKKSSVSKGGRKLLSRPQSKFFDAHGGRKELWDRMERSRTPLTFVTASASASVSGADPAPVRQPATPPCEADKPVVDKVSAAVSARPQANPSSVAAATSTSESAPVTNVTHATGKSDSGRKHIPAGTVVRLTVLTDGERKIEFIPPSSNATPAEGVPRKGKPEIPSRTTHEQVIVEEVAQSHMALSSATTSLAKNESTPIEGKTAPSGAVLVVKQGIPSPPPGTKAVENASANPASPRPKTSAPDAVSDPIAAHDTPRATPSHTAATPEPKPEPNVKTRAEMRDVIQVTVENAKSVTLPAGYRTSTFGDMALLLTPEGPMQIPEKGGLYLEKGIRGEYQCLSERQFESQQERRKKTKEKYQKMVRNESTQRARLVNKKN